MSYNLDKEEVIDKYLTDAMDEGEKRNFEIELEKNPSLKEEVEFQNDLVKSLRDHRRAELKSRLNEIKVGTSYSSYIAAGISAFVVVALLSVWSGLFSDKENITTENISTSPIENEVKPQEKEAPINISETQEQPDKQLSDKPSNKVYPDPKETTNISKSASVEKEEVQKPKEQVKIEAPNLPESSEDQVIEKSLPETNSTQIGTTDMRNVSKVEIEFKTKKDLDFHYQFYANKLFLFGDFSGSPYELLELNTSKKQDLYLYFKGQFYALKSSQVEPTKLVALDDKVRIKSLQDLQSR